MSGYLLQRITRFRAYQLGNRGSSFSYFDGTRFTLVEARLTDLSRPRVKKEMEICNVSRVGCLHITSWDTDHCVESELEEILYTLFPEKIECPGYPPESDTAKRCLRLIQEYRAKMEQRRITASVVIINPDFVNGLNPGEEFGYRDIVYHPTYLSDNKNDNSTVQLFRTGVFNVASLGDVESPMIGSYLRSRRIFSSETDVLILAHHGADNGLTNSKFLKKVAPTIAICSSNYDNQFDHPRDEIRNLLRNQKIKLYTTKLGDVAVQSTGTHTHEYRVINLKADSTEISSTADFVSKKSNKLRFNMDTVRNVYGTRRSFPC
jgi:competence protein ComEC